MKADEIENAVQEFREQQIQAMHRRVNATAPRDQTPEFVASEMRGVNAFVERYRASLGQPDDQPAEQQDVEAPEPVAVKPGVKSE